MTNIWDVMGYFALVVAAITTDIGWFAVCLCFWIRADLRRLTDTSTAEHP